MSSEEYLKDVPLGEVLVHNRKIELEEYNVNWPSFFQVEAEKIKNALKDKALRIEHVGSTSVPGLCAKPVIDILLLVEESSSESSYVEALESAGYVLRIREPEWFEHRMFKGSDPAVNLHVFSRNCLEAKRMLVFRDWLRENEQDRNVYAETKKELAHKVWTYIQDYADAKSQIIQDILKRALK